ncbi:uncharacterized protein LOC111627099 [Centruroides sculpturatus]|uniref:uncharacterized protein LOC111627099 n=1 Tax=Centruroides sculpturatus TaxID=218467 RepID=UPI000C6EE420|nr:uncharacterized protein LOC111627099 [Centruroides sculpturatus]
MNPQAPTNYLSVSVEIISQVMTFIEVGRTEFSSLENGKQVYNFSKIHKMTPLRKLAAKYILSVTNKENIFNVYDFACKVADNNIKYKCWKWFDDECMEVFEKSNCFNCSENTISTLVSRPIYKWMDEADVFHIVYHWAEANVTKSANLRTVIEPYLSKIRFLTISPERFNRSVLPLAKGQLLTDEEIEGIKESLPTTSVSNLPATICRNTKKRRNTYYENLFSYKNRSSMKSDKDILVTGNTRFLCKIIAKHNCFVTEIILPIRHARHGSISVFVDVFNTYRGNSFTQKFSCGAEGRAIGSFYIYIKKYKSYEITARIKETHILPENKIRVIKDSHYYIPSGEENEATNNEKEEENNRQNFYFEVNLYF